MALGKWAEVSWVGTMWGQCKRAFLQLHVQNTCSTYQTPVLGIKCMTMMNIGTLVLRKLRPGEAKGHAQSHTAYEGQSKDWELSKPHPLPTLTGHDSGGQPFLDSGWEHGSSFSVYPGILSPGQPSLPTSSALMDVGYAFDFCASLHRLGWRL